MGCAQSVEKEETVQRCRERRQLMKQLLICRAEFASAHMAYLRSLRNTGATLRQFTEVDESVDEPLDFTLPPSPPPPPPLPPSPPPPPQFSSKKKKELVASDRFGINDDEDEDDDDESCVLPPPPLHGSNFDFWDPFSLPTTPVKHASGAESQVAASEDENWAETYTDFEEEEDEETEEVVVEVKGQNKDFIIPNNKLIVNPAREIDDNSSAISGVTKDSDAADVVWRAKKTLAGIMKEVDEFFLKAAAGGKDLAILLDSNQGARLDWNIEKRNGKTTKSAKVFSALSWSWSSKSLNSSKDGYLEGADRRLGNLCNTLEKIYTEEQKLYKDVKEEEMAKSQYEKKKLVLQRLETKEHDLLRAEKLRSNIEYLQTRIMSLQESNNSTCLSISKLRDEDLYPQLAELSFSLEQMWRTMYDCHQIQNYISQQANLIDNHHGMEPITESHRQATAQLENEVNSWHSSFCNLLRAQREYVNVLNQWVRLTDCLLDNTGTASGIHCLCEKWKLALDRLPDKVAAEAIKSFLSIIHSIDVQQTEEFKLKRRSDRLESKLEKEMSSFHELENLIENPGQSNNHSAQTRHVKLDNLRKLAEEERSKYLNAVRVTRAMTLNNLQTSLPNIFQALMGFASVCVQVLEAINCPSSDSGDVNSEGIACLDSHN